MQKWYYRPTLEVCNRLWKVKEFLAANRVMSGWEHTLLCSGEHNNPLLKRMLFIWIVNMSIQLPLASFPGAKLLRLIRLGNSHQPPLTATLQQNTTISHAIVNEWVHECTESSVFPLLETLKLQVIEMSKRQGTESSMFWCFNDLVIW